MCHEWLKDVPWREVSAHNHVVDTRASRASPSHRGPGPARLIRVEYKSVLGNLIVPRFSFVVPKTVQRPIAISLVFLERETVPSCLGSGTEFVQPDIDRSIYVDLESNSHVCVCVAITDLDKLSVSRIRDYVVATISILMCRTFPAGHGFSGVRKIPFTLRS